MRKIYSPFNPPPVVAVAPIGDSVTVQGIVTSLSVILSGHDDNNMKVQEQGYSETVRELYPEVFGRPTKYELEYERQAAEAYAQEMGVNNEPAEPAAAPSSDAPSEEKK